MTAGLFVSGSQTGEKIKEALERKIGMHIVFFLQRIAVVISAKRPVKSALSPAVRLLQRASAPKKKKRKKKQTHLFPPVQVRRS